jgi:hypothetical protein
MPVQEILILALTQMRSGICVAGFTREPDPVTGLRWVRPVRDFETVLPGDMTDADGNAFQCGDVIALNLVAPRPDPPHIEDWRTDFVHPRPRLLRRLEGDRRAQFFAAHLDRAPEDVLAHQTRSLCLVQPERVWAEFALDAESGKYEARIGFTLPGVPDHPRAASPRGVAVTDLRWRDLGRTWLEEGENRLAVGHAALLDQLHCQLLYLVVGLSRSWQGEYWPLVVGVHTVPDY